MYVFIMQKLEFIHKNGEIQITQSWKTRKTGLGKVVTPTCSGIVRRYPRRMMKHRVGIVKNRRV